MARIAMACIVLLGLVGVLSCSTGKAKVDDMAGVEEIAEVVSSDVRSPEPVCVPGEKACQDGQTCTCNSHGTAWTCSDCYGNKQKCFEGECCKPDCEWGDQCGDDGCGGICGDCGPYVTCDETHRLCGPPCSEELFGENVCGSGKDGKSSCGTCLAEAEFECIFDELEGEYLLRTSCVCPMDETEFHCFWQIPPDGYEACSSSADCPGSSDPDNQSSYCLQPCNEHVTPFCGTPCDSHSDCDADHYCGTAYSVEHNDVGHHCIPKGLSACLFSCAPMPGYFRCPCEEDQECDGHCMPGRHGSYCAPGYDAGGCGGYDQLEYMQVWLGTADIIYLCVERAINLCLPCQEDSDCLLPWAMPGHDYGDKCISYGDAGSFCGIECQALWDGDCPSGYQCVDGQCVSESGTCNCPPYHVELGAATTCMSSNEHGVCQGTRTCTEKGLSDCDATVPAPEECDGLDNDCDGLADDGFEDTDEDGTPDCCEPNDGCGGYLVEGAGVGSCFVQNEFGICFGVYSCTAGKWSCEAATPKQEVCNGIDDDCDDHIDDGYPDVNQDCLADCVEIDLDFDGVPDWVDNCPESFNPGQEDAEGDQVGDLCDPDDDNDGVADEDDNCPYAVNENQADIDQNGVGDVCETDADGDGFEVPEDCNDMNLTVYPGTEEICDWNDNDCDGQVNEGLPNPDGLLGPFSNCTDTDEDEDCVPDATDNCPEVKNRGQLNLDSDELGDACDPDKDDDGTANEQDCDPMDGWTFPGAPEKCDNKDNDCDGETDEGAAEVDCQDCDPCTVDVCDPAKGCLHEPVECSEGQVCNEWGQCE